MKVDIEPAVLDLSTGVVSRQGCRAQLRVKESLIFDALLRAYPRALTQDALMSALYALEAAEPNAKIVSVYICKLRTALREAGLPVWVVTRYSFGWSLSYSPPPARPKPLRKQYAGKVIQARGEMLLTLLRPHAGKVVPTDEVLGALCISRAAYEGSKMGIIHYVLRYLRARGVRVWHAKCGDEAGYFLEAEAAPKLELVKVSA